MAISAASFFLPQIVLNAIGEGNESCEGEVLVAGAKNYLKGMLGLKRGEKVFIVYDEESKEIARAFTESAKKLGAQVTDHHIGANRFNAEGVRAILQKITPQSVLFIDDKQYDALSEKVEKGEKPPLAANYDLFINLVTDRPEDRSGRVRVLMSQYMLGKATGKVRTGHAPGIIKEMICLKPDFKKMDSDAKKLVDLFKSAENVKVTTAKGTTVELKVLGRAPAVDVLIDAGGIGNIPSGEIYLAPIETEGSGEIIVDGSIGSVGMVPSPIKIKIKNGKIESIGWQQEGYDNPACLGKIKKILGTDEWASVIGELGIGLAPFPLVGNLLQDEKAAGTVHIAFGNNYPDFPGGQNKSGVHLDFMILAPTVTIYYTKESGKSPKMIMEKGGLLLD